ncbi:hypothetical protein AKJ09_06165 [Labilithrix luteola]|uniref:Tetratricopeptide repeat protein n=1 Tax=Labilithrix luteola TaxID=1391654 RepID=A0A0K1Q1J0_9BACT|nr:hypothetical protein [Labilithrix luteola]AKU99501.1 hypothetical protein AKJ09_06165 [Labilithrix luteola]
MANHEFEPLLRGDATDAERALLEAAKPDAARRGARDKMLSALGRRPIAAPPTAMARVARALRSAGGSYLHAILLVLVVGAGSGAAVTFGRSAKGPLATGDVVSNVVNQPSPAPNTPSSATSAAAPDDRKNEAPSITPESLPSVAVTVGSPSKAPSAMPSMNASDVASDAETLVRETPRVDAARAALTRGDAASTLRLLDAYDREFPRGTFTVEVTVLRVEALAQAGHLDEARRLGRRFLATHREGPYARRVGVVLAAASDGPRGNGPSSSPPED